MKKAYGIVAVNLDKTKRLKMNETQDKSKLQIVEKIKAATNVLIAVGNNPSVDELSSALGLTALLNKLDKHATAIFSGAIPPAISFLEPDKVFENTADSLRDFIIALDKEKADHLRYKIEGDVVKIFITPYRTTITQDDLEFSQGDYNVDLVLALNVEDQEHLDTALSAHKEIMEDVTIATICANGKSSQLGTIAWRDETASSLCEMIAGIADSLKTDKVALLDKQISTALLTGVVAATDRFSNEYTTSEVMSVAAQLMAAGADQQLIAAKLQENHEINSLPTNAITEEQVGKTQTDEGLGDKSDNDGSLSISHDEPEPIPEAPKEEVPAEIPEVPGEPEVSVPEPVAETPVTEVKVDETVSTEKAEEPILGGILNATTDQAAEDAQRELDEQQNKTILSHTYLAGSDNSQATINGVGQSEETQNVDIFNQPAASTLPPSAPTTDEGGLPLPPPLPDFSSLPPISTLPPDSTVPPVPPTPPVSTEPATSTDSTVPPATPPAPTEGSDQAGSDASQFKIPGSQ